MADKIVQLTDKDGNNIYPNTRNTFKSGNLFSFEKLKELQSIYEGSPGATYNLTNKTISISTGSSNDWYTPGVHSDNIGKREIEFSRIYGLDIKPRTTYRFDLDYNFSAEVDYFGIHAFYFDQYGQLISYERLTHVGKSGHYQKYNYSPANAKFMVVRFSIYNSPNITGTISNIAIYECYPNVVQFKNDEGELIYPTGVFDNGTQLTNKGKNLLALGICNTKYTVTYKLPNDCSCDTTPKSSFYKTDSSFTLPNVTCSRSGYTFRGWARSPQGTPSKPYTINPVNEDADIIMYAIFDKYHVDVNWQDMTTATVKWTSAPYLFDIYWGETKVLSDTIDYNGDVPAGTTVSIRNLRQYDTSYTLYDPQITLSRKIDWSWNPSIRFKQV